MKLVEEQENTRNMKLFLEKKNVILNSIYLLN